MKRSFKRMLSMGLLAAVLLCVFSFGGVFAAGDATDTVRAGRLTGKNWMSGIPDDRYLYEINLPGTHDCVTAYCKNTTDNAVKLFGRPVYDSGEYAKTQSLTLSEQLNAGVRYLDLRFSAKQGKLLLCHGNNERIAVINKIMQGLDAFNPSAALLHRERAPFLELDTEFYAYKDAGCTVPFTGKRVFSLLKRFLKKHPSETIIITAKKENGDTNEFFRLFKKQIERLKTEINPATQQPYLYTENGNGLYTKMPALSQVRGKIILMTPFYEELQTGDMLDSKNKAGQTDFMGMTFRYENHWSVPSCLKTMFVHRFLKKTAIEMSADGEQHLPVANLLKTNASVVLLQSPQTIAAKVNDFLYRQNRLKKGWYYGWIMGDFMTKETCAAIWQTNNFVFDDSL